MSESRRKRRAFGALSLASLEGGWWVASFPTQAWGIGGRNVHPPEDVWRWLG